MPLSAPEYTRSKGRQLTGGLIESTIHKTAAGEKRALHRKAIKRAIAEKPMLGHTMIHGQIVPAAFVRHAVIEPAIDHTQAQNGTVHHPPVRQITVLGPNVTQGLFDQNLAGDVLVYQRAVAGFHGKSPVFRPEYQGSEWFWPCI